MKLIRDKKVKYNTSLGYLKEILNIKNDISLNREVGVIYLANRDMKIRILCKQDELDAVQINNQFCSVRFLNAFKILDFVLIEFAVPQNNTYAIYSNDEGKALLWEEINI